MWMLLKMALRNLRRNLRRTLITMTAISGGLALMLFQDAMQNGSYQEFIRVGVSSMAGHVVVQPEGYQADPEMENLMADAGAVEATLEQTFPDARVVQRALIQGLLQSPRNTAGVGISGVEPTEEIEVSDWQDKVIEGEWLSDNPRDIVLGHALANTLEVELGDKVVLMAQGPNEVTSRLFRVKGLLRTGSADADGAFAIANITALAEVMEAPGSAHQVSVHLPNPSMSEAATRKARAALESTDGIEILSWQEALPDMVAFIRMDKQSGRVGMLAIGIIVAMGVLNTVLMSVMERVRELGVMLALGVSPRNVAGLVVLEGIVLGFISAVVGAALGLAVILPTSRSGIDFSAMMGAEVMEVEGIAISTIIFPTPNWPALVTFCAIAWLFTVLSSLWPALHAARLRPVDAMRHI
jgi:ABC-type lipoprotein release transport system permease subunit